MSYKADRLQRELDAAKSRIEQLEAQVEDLTKQLAEVKNSKPPKFPDVLRKMWSGGEVQKWVDRNWQNRINMVSGNKKIRPQEPTTAKQP